MTNMLMYSPKQAQTIKTVKIMPYLRLMRMHRPIGTFLLLWPTLWALWIAGQGQPDPNVVLIFIIGSVIMRAAGCVINDYADRNFDGHVKRTAGRPLITDEISPVVALLLFVVLVGIAFILVLQLNTKTIVLSFFALAFAVCYPFAKRFTHLPQLLLGIAFSSAILMSFAAIGDKLPITAWLLFIANLCWVVAYDTQYAMTDREDDLLIGIKSTAILFDEKDIFYIAALQAAMLLLLAVTGYVIQSNGYFYLSLVIAGFFFIYQHVLTYNRERQQCFKAFLNNNWVGGVVFSGVILGLIKV